MDIIQHHPTKTRVTFKTTEVPQKSVISQKLPESSHHTSSEESSKSQSSSNQKQAEDSEHQEEGLYVISVAARLLEMHPQTLRKYERAGLVRPSRTIGMLRLYSEDDISRLRIIKYLVDNLGLNIAGVNLTLSLVDSLITMSNKLEEMGLNDFRDAVNNQISELLNMLEIL